MTNEEMLMEKVTKLGRMVNWLANELDARKICISDKENCWYDAGEEDCRMCWIEKARKAVEVEGGHVTTSK